MFATNVGNFWVWITIATASLSALTLAYIPNLLKTDKPWRHHIIWGLGSAAGLYAIFYFGDFLTRWLAFQDTQVTSIYGTKSQSSALLIGFLLVFIIGPGEEIFWRGFVQNRMSQVWGGWRGYMFAGLLYGAVHIPSMNFMLIAAAVICGFYWGLLYKITGSIIPGIISHAVWDLSIFVVFPLR